jgi:nucleoid DNA-binding protein
MNKQDVLEAVASQTGNIKAAVDETLTAVLATITKEVSAGARGAVGRVR